MSAFKAFRARYTYWDVIGGLAMTLFPLIIAWALLNWYVESSGDTAESVVRSWWEV